MALPRVALEIGQGDDTWGTVVLELEAEKTPKTVENFLNYVDAKFYDGTIFHRVISHFMIQGGGYTALNDHKTAGLNDPIENEAKDGIENETGTIAMARTNDPHSATSQFFINVADNDFLNHPGQDSWGYCAFGRVVEGMDVIERVKQVETQSSSMTGEQSEPVNPPKIIRATRQDA